MLVVLPPSKRILEAGSLTYRENHWTAPPRKPGKNFVIGWEDWDIPISTEQLTTIQMSVAKTVTALNWKSADPAQLNHLYGKFWEHLLTDNIADLLARAEYPQHHSHILEKWTPFLRFSMTDRESCHSLPATGHLLGLLNLHIL